MQKQHRFKHAVSRDVFSLLHTIESQQLHDKRAYPTCCELTPPVASNIEEKCMVHLTHILNDLNVSSSKRVGALQQGHVS
jgi:hypothetical protein